MYPSKQLNVHTLPHNYCQVFLYKDGKSCGKLVHRLVAEVFLPNPAMKPEVNHIDRDPTNNAVQNLEWCTKLENTKHAIATGWTPGLGRKGTRNSNTRNSKMSEVKRLPVRCVQTGQVFKSMRAADSWLGISEGQVSNSISKHTSIKGFTFVKVPKEII